MTTRSFEGYGKLANMKALKRTERSGRYSIQREAERRILGDVISKLQIQPTDRLIDIGCGSGLLLLPLAYIVERVTALDHPAVVAGIANAHPGLDADFVGASFLDWQPDRTFTKAVAYGVVNCVETSADAHAFILKAARLLEPGGRLLIADVPNVDRKARFARSEAGKAFSAEWERLIASSGGIPSAFAQLVNPEVVRFDDALVLEILAALRAEGFDAFVVPQPPDLPFGHTREDILVHRPPA